MLTLISVFLVTAGGFAVSIIVTDPTPQDTTAQDNADIESAKTRIQDLSLSATAYNQSQGNTQSSVKTIVQSAINGLNLDTEYGVSISIIDGSFTPATAGTLGTPLGTNGSASFSIQITKGMGTLDSVETTIIIVATALLPSTPSAPTGLSTSIGDKRITLSWTMLENDGGSSIIRYEVSTDGSSWHTATMPHTFTELTNGAQYGLYVRAVNATGNGTYSYTSAAPVGTPDAPQNFTAIVGDGQVSLSWNAVTGSSTQGRTITGYEVTYNDFVAGTETVVKQNTQSSHTFTGLTNGQSYTFKVRAIYEGGSGDISSAAMTPLGTPDAPQNFTAIASTTDVVLSWTAPASMEGRIATGYQVSSDNGSTWVNANSDTEHTFTGLNQAQFYTFVVRVVFEGGTGTATTGLERMLFPFQSGTGTENDPYVIVSSTQLMSLATLVNTVNNYSLNKYFELGANIDLHGNEWEPIGYINNDSYYGRMFQGNFDGKGFSVSNFIITVNNHVNSEGVNTGLFGFTRNATISNVTVTDFEISITISSDANLSVGGVVGSSANSSIINCFAFSGEIILAHNASQGSIIAGGLVGHDVYNSLITNCGAAVNINVKKSSSSSGCYIGGLVGSSSSAQTMENCYATGNINFENERNVKSIIDEYYIGGLIGQCYSNITVQNCYATGDIDAITISGYLLVGGLIGGARGPASNFYDSYATGDVSAEGKYYYTFAGGLIGQIGATSFSSTYQSCVDNCYATGNVMATITDASSYYAYAGGLIGYNESEKTTTNSWASGTVQSSDYAGGLIGQNYSAVTSCFATGDVGAQTYGGGLIGYNRGNISQSYATGDVYGQSSRQVQIGGLAGNHSGVLTNCFATGNIDVKSTGQYAIGGGLIGLSYNSTITNCYSVGDVVGLSVGSVVMVGGFVGINHGSTIRNCFAIGDVSGSTTSTFSNDIIGSGVGAFIGKNDSGTINNSFISDEQVIYAESGLGEMTSNSDFATEFSPEQLDEIAFYTLTLGWDIDVWDFDNLDFANNIFPTLKHSID